MNDKKNIKDFFNLSFFVRLAVIVLVILLAVFLYHFGKQHTVYIDNRTIEIDGVSYKALDWAEAYVDDGESQEYTPRTRREATVQRQKHSIHVLYSLPWSQDLMMTSTSQSSYRWHSSSD